MVRQPPHARQLRQHEKRLQRVPGGVQVEQAIDAVREGVQAVVAGKINCTVECNPLFGPKVYDTVTKVLAGEKVPRKSYNKDELFDATNAAAALPTRQY